MTAKNPTAATATPTLLRVAALGAAAGAPSEGGLEIEGDGEACEGGEASGGATLDLGECDGGS